MASLKDISRNLEDYFKKSRFNIPAQLRASQSPNALPRIKNFAGHVAANPYLNRVAQRANSMRGYETPLSHRSISLAQQNASQLGDYLINRSIQPNTPGISDNISRMAQGAGGKLLKVTSHPLGWAASGSRDVGSGIQNRNPLEVAKGTGKILGAGGSLYYGGKLIGKGGPLGVVSRAGQGAVLNTAMNTGSTLFREGRLPTADENTKAAQSGVENSWTLAITNAVTDKVLASLGANKIVGDAITEPFKDKAVKEGFKRVFTRALAEVPAENTAFTWLNRLDGQSKESFMNDWITALPGSIASNLAFAFLQGSYNTAKNTDIGSDVGDTVNKALNETLRKWNTPVTTMELDQNGRRITVPMWQYKMQNKVGLSVQDINKLSPDDYTKAKSGSLDPISSRTGMIQRLEIAGVASKKQLEELPTPKLQKLLEDNVFKVGKALGDNKATPPSPDSSFEQIQAWQKQTQPQVDALAKQIKNGEITPDQIMEQINQKTLNMDIYQRANEKAQGIELFTKFNQATQAGDEAAAGKIAKQIANAPDNSPIAAYKQTVADKMARISQGGFFSIGNKPKEMNFTAKDSNATEDFTNYQNRLKAQGVPESKIPQAESGVGDTKPIRPSNVTDAEIVRKQEADMIARQGQDQSDFGLSAKSTTQKSGKAAREVEQVFRTDKFNVPEDEIKILEDIQKSLGLDTRKVRSFEEMRAMADELQVDPKKLLTDVKSGRITDKEVFALGDIISTSSQRISKLSKELEANPDSIDTRNALAAEEAIINQAIKKRITGLTEAGRTVVAAKAIAKNTLDRTYWLDKAQRQMGDKPLKADTITVIDDLIKGKDRLGLAVLISKLGESGFEDKAITLWKAGLLTGLRTHEANMISNTAMGTMETIKDIPATGFDIARSKITGKPRTKTFNANTLAQTLKGTGVGIEQAKQYMKEGIDPREVEKLDIFTPTRYNLDRKSGRFLQKYTDFVFKTLGSEDKVFREAAFYRSLSEQASLRGINDGLTVKEVDALFQKPTPEMVDIALQDAKYATFNKDNILAEAIGRFSRTNRATKVITNVVAPFRRTPTNVAEAAFDYTPAGFIKDLSVKIINGDYVSDKRLADSFGRSVTGTALLWLGYELAKAGMMTGGRSSSQAENAENSLEGKPNNAIFINGKWRQLGRVSPIGNLLGLGVAWYESGKSLSTTAAKGVKDLTDQTFLRGVSSGLKAIEDPERYASSFLENTVAGFVPSVVNDISRGTDKYIRSADGLTQRVISRTPLRNRLPIKINQLGDPVLNESGFIGSMTDPFNSRTPNQDPLVQEFARVGYNLNYVGDTLGGKKLTPEQERRYQELAGKQIREFVTPLLSNKSYLQASQDVKKDLIEKLVNKAKAVARDEIKKNLNTSDAGLFDVKAAEFESSKDAPKELIGKLDLYIKAATTDPKNTIKAMFTKERLRKVTGDAAILERQKYINTSGSGYEVDHQIPLSLGGDNSPDNLVWYEPSVKAEKDKLEYKLYLQLKEGEISKKEAQKQITAWVDKNGSGVPYEQGPPGQLTEPETSLVDKVDNPEYIDGDVQYLPKEDGTLETIDTRIPEPPVFTGSEVVDKKLKSNYKSKITKAQNAYLKLMEAGEMSQDEAVAKYEELELLKDAIDEKTSGGKSKGKKGKKAKPLQFSAPPSPIKISGFKFTPPPKINIPKPKSIKIKAAPARVARITPQAFRNDLMGGTIKLG